MGPLIVQSDRTVMLELDHPDAEQARHDLGAFAELERAPEHIHTYRITRLGLWNAQAAGMTCEEILDVLHRYAKVPVPSAVEREIRDATRRFGVLRIVRHEDHLLRTSVDPAVLIEISQNKKVAELLGRRLDEHTWEVGDWARGQLKQQLLRRGWPAADEAGYTPGEPFPISLTEDGWTLRPYQRAAVDRFVEHGSGVVVLPCGAGKTLVGAGAMAAVGRKTLILVTNTVAARQWRTELLARTSLTPEDIGEYSGEQKTIAPVTIATYQILTARRGSTYRHLGVLDAQDWGLIVYDEVHLLPAPVFKLTADLQTRLRLGLTATLVREDGRERDVFSLIGPKRYDVPWKDIESMGYIAPADCREIRVDLTEKERLEYAAMGDQDRYRFASTCPAKIAVTKALLARHPGEQILIIAQYLDQIENLEQSLGVPAVTGRTPTAEREERFEAFRTKALPVLIVSKVANFSVDLPEARIAIQLSGAYGSRQEEAQRLGRILRPKQDGGSATFYTVVARDTSEQDFALNRQRFLAEQGYGYRIVDASELLAPARPGN
ncbi:MAG: DEAD/DEAH box helicase [Microbacteriaceae bacterium]|jgi:DNA excision repair protein ERCC-3|nr:DEAD/DEAH box helicase [Microbacteriaceae bacterium]